MGFQLTIKYHPKKSDGDFGFDHEKTEEKVFKVGKKEDETSVEQLAAAVLKQLARRDIYVHDIEAIEFVRKKIQIKNSKNGIVIGNKRYTFTDVQDISVEEEVPSSPSPQPQPQQVARPNVVAPPKQFSTAREVRFEFFDPDPVYAKTMATKFKQQGLTIGKRYKILDSSGEFYLVLNDMGKEVRTSPQHFSVVGPNIDLKAEGEQNLAHKEEIELDYPGMIRGGGDKIFGMPKLR